MEKRNDFAEVSKNLTRFDHFRKFKYNEQCCKKF